MILHLQTFDFLGDDLWEVQEDFLKNVSKLFSIKID